MTFGDFARNYLNPFYLVFRLGFLGVGLFLAVVVGLLSLSPPWVRLGAGALGLWLCWIGLKPWGKGITLDELNRQAERLRR